MKRLTAEGTWPEDVEVWQVALDLTRPLAGVHSLSFLSDDERARAMRYRRHADQVRFVATRSALRQLLAEAIGIDPARLRFELSDRGKPRLADPGRLSFNVSHAGERALIAFSPVREIGIDIEQVDVALDWRELSPLVCTAAERRVLDALPPALQRERLFRCWTAKEALLKALGLGISERLQALTIDLSRPDETGASSPVVIEDAPFDDAATKLRFCWLDVDPGYLGCLAYGPNEPPRT
jgi:4'-phosphopantetheinyl transferase